MALYNPTAIVVNGSPAVNVTLTGTVTYQQFLQSLGAYVYQFDELYIWTTNIAQLTAPIKYEYTNANGDSQTEIITPKIDPYQPSPALYVSLKGMAAPVIIDDSATIAFALAPLTTIKFKFFGKVSTVADYLSGIDNFKDVSIEMGMEDFFESQDQIED